MKIFKFFITIIFSVVILSVSASSQTHKPEIFEGNIHAINFKNIDDKTIALSSGVGYNGNEKITYTIKDNFILVTNHTLHYSILWDSDAITVTVWSNLLKEGKIFNLYDFIKIFSVFTNNPRTVGMLWMKQNIPGFKYKFDNKIKIQTLNEDGYFQSGRIENSYSGVDMEYAYCTKYKMPYYMKDAQIYGFNNIPENFLITKFRFTIDTRTASNSKLKGYQGQEITEINPQKLDISTFAVPDNIKLKKSGIAGLNGFYKNLGKALKKNNLYPTDNEVAYEINENDWAY